MRRASLKSARIVPGSSIFGAFDRQEPVQVSNHEPFKRPGRRKEVNEEEEQELTCPTLVDPLRGRQQIKATLLSYILLCFVISIVGLSSTPSVVLEESLGIGIDHHLSIQTKQGVFRGLLMTSEVSDWPSGLQSQKINSETLSDIIVGFLGIRYASAPVKRLRFMPPTAFLYSNQPPNQVHNMQKFGPICKQRFPVDVPNENLIASHSLNNRKDSLKIQLRLMKSLLPKESFAELSPFIKRLSAFEQSEDCLNLNVYAPLQAFKSHPPNGFANPLATNKTNASSRGSQLPVLVVIHGESFDYGSGSAINAQKFVHQTKLVVVTFNFRLNVLGFPPKLAGGSLRGNLGLMDQVAALHWIRDNIEAFGGSPDNITLMGTKRAAIAINLLMLSPLAKGLFKRAIMEDGSALTPLIANHIVTPSAHPIANNMPPALLHLRLLARLSDCPVYLGVPNKSVGSNNGNNNNNNNSVQSVAQHLSSNNNNNNNNNAASGHSSNAMLIETKTNALTIECLRQKPIEQIMQRIPLDLLHLDQTSGDISVPVRWLRILSQVSQTSNFTQPNSNSIDAVELNRLISTATKLKLEKEEGVTANSSSLDYLKASDEANELFGAIYAQPSASMQPVFGPIMDGTIVPNEEISLAMLKQNSTFAQHDLLIGLSQSTMIKQSQPTGTMNETSTHDDAQQQQQQQREDLAEIKIRPDYSVADRFTSHLEQNGLTNEQAVSMINVFVRSFYRHHNQEITNSIVNHYLNGQSSNNNKHRSKGSKRVVYNGEQARALSEINDSDEFERRLLVLDSMLEIFQDALRSVPVLKTALIHATKQLDPLVEAFVGQEFDKWTELQLSNESSSFRNTSLVDSSNQQYDQKFILESFIKFSKTLFEDPNWPLELRSPVPTNRILTQPRSTYLYRLESQLPISNLRKFATKFNNSKQMVTNSGWFQQAVSDALSALLDDISSDNHQIPMSIGCAIDSSLYDDSNENFNNNNKLSLFELLSDRFCSRMSLIVSRFVSTGKMGVFSFKQLNTLSHGASLIDRLRRYESKCLAIADANSVQPAEPNDTILNDTTSQQVDSQTCQPELESLALDHLIEEFERFSGHDDNESSQDQQWSTFDLFTQQVASIFVTGEPALLMSQVSHEDTISADSSHENPKSTLLARSSFWLNFIPALNCTKTLPIIPNNPLVSISSSSLLLELNLQFNCQKGAKTVFNVLESLAASIKQQLLSRASQWLANHSTSSSITSFSQQTYSVANMSRTDDSDQQELPGSENQVSQSNSSLIPSLSINDLQTNTIQSIDKHNNTGRAFIDLRSRYIAMVLLICGLVIGLTLATGACSVLRQRQNKTHEAKRRKSSLQIQTNQTVIDGSMIQHQMTTNIDYNHQTQHTLTHDTSKSFAEPSSDNRNKTIENGVDITLTLDNTHYDCEEPRVQLETCETVEQQQQLQDCSPAENNHVCTISNNQEDNFVCWAAINGNHANEFLDNSMSLCRSHSSLSANLISEHEQPIMLPILANHSTGFQTRVPIKRDCLENSNFDNNFGGSSSETQVPSSGSSTTKKRVKISDPLATERRTNRSKAYNYYNKQNNELQTVPTVDTGTIYCPIHLNQSNTSLNMTNSGYYVDDRIAFLAPNNIELWNNPDFEQAIAGQHNHRTNCQYQDRMGNSSFKFVSNTQPNQEQQVIPNGFIVTSARHRGQTTSGNVELRTIQ